MPVEALPDGEYCAIERCANSTHNGTHLDAPYHFFSSMNHRLKPGGEASMRIDEVPLDWCFQPGVKLDFRHFEDGYVATPADVEAELKRIGHQLKPLEIVLVNTRAGSRPGDTAMSTRVAEWERPRPYGCSSAACGSSAPTAGVGTRPSPTRAARSRRRGMPCDLGGPIAGREDRLFHLEKLHNLGGSCRHDGFEIVCFPVKVWRGSAGWTRTVAIAFPNSDQR